MPSHVFTAGEASRHSGVPYPTVSYWAKTGFLCPSVAQGSGPGSRRLYSFQDLVALRIARNLRVAGISLRGIRKVITHMKSRGESTPLSSVFLVTDGKDVYERQGKQQLFSLLRTPGQGVFTWIDIGRIDEELRELIAA